MAWLITQPGNGLRSFHDTKMNEMNKQLAVNNDTALVRLPLWKSFLDGLRQRGELSYGATWDVSVFESAFRCKADDEQFDFQVLAMRQEVEENDGFYLHQSGSKFYIPTAAEHEDVARVFETKLKRYSRRAVNIRHATLTNETANLTDEERRKMENGHARAAIRLALLCRQRKLCGSTIPNSFRTRDGRTP